MCMAWAWRAQEVRLPEQALPEMMRVPLENLYLQVVSLPQP